MCVCVCVCVCTRSVAVIEVAAIVCVDCVHMSGWTLSMK